MNRSQGETSSDASRLQVVSKISILTITWMFRWTREYLTWDHIDIISRSDIFDQKYNKRPKGPHIVHLSKMCHLFEESAKVDICLLISPKNTNLVEDFEILLAVKFCWILFSGYRGKVENVSANQKPGRPSCFSGWTEKQKLGRGRWDLASCQVSLNSVQRFQRRSRKCLSQSEARAAILFFRPAQKHKRGRGLWDLASCQVSLNSV